MVGFWDISVEEIFCVVRDIVDLVEICGDKLFMLVLVLFFVWIVVFVGIYVVYFFYMDIKGYMFFFFLGDFEIIKNGFIGIIFFIFK